MTGNPDIEQLGAATRFGQPGGPNPAEASARERAWSIRNGVRRIAAAEFDLESGVPMEQQLKQVFGKKMTGAQIAALSRFGAALKPGPSHAKFSQMVTEDVDGKLVERVIEAKATLADLVNGSYDVEPD